jgi:hypothetical protein
VRFDPDGLPVLLDTAKTAGHPQFDLKALFAHRITADVPPTWLDFPKFAPWRLPQPNLITRGNTQPRERLVSSRSDRSNI